MNWPEEFQRNVVSKNISHLFEKKIILPLSNLSTHERLFAGHDADCASADSKMSTWTQILENRLQVGIGIKKFFLSGMKNKVRPTGNAQLLGI